MARQILSAGWCNGKILPSQAADRGSIPGCGRSASHQTVSGTALAGDAHSLVGRTNPQQLVQYGVAQGYRKGDEHLKLSQKMEVTLPCLVVVCVIWTSSVTKSATDLWQTVNRFT